MVIEEKRAAAKAVKGGQVENLTATIASENRGRPKQNEERLIDSSDEENIEVVATNKGPLFFY